MHHPKNIDRFPTDAIGHDIRRAADRQFPRPQAPAHTPHLRYDDKVRDRRDNPFDLAVSGGRIVLSDESASHYQILDGGFRPD